MQLPDLKQLDKLVQLCRKRGVKVIRLGEMELTLSDEAPTKSSKKSQEATAQSPSIFETDSLTEQQLLEWSVMQVPDISSPGAVDEGGSA